MTMVAVDFYGVYITSDGIIKTYDNYYGARMRLPPPLYVRSRATNILTELLGKAHHTGGNGYL